jgi:hypothetical protein
MTIPDRYDPGGGIRDPHPAMLARCRFWIRTRAPAAAGDPIGRLHDEPVTLGSPDGSACLITFHPPAAGDLIFLFDAVTRRGGLYRVFDRAWHHASYGSPAWGSVLNGLPATGPGLDVYVEDAAPGPGETGVPDAPPG